MSSAPVFPPTSKRRSFRPSTYRPLNPPTSLDSLNDSLRASLMSVGMRVRKSVPEGYKTTTKPQFSIYEQTAAAYPELQSFAGTKVTPPITSTEMMTDAELHDAVDSVLDGLDDDLSGWDSLGSSQESNGSGVSMTSSVRFPAAGMVERGGRRKRSLGDDEEELSAVPMERDTPLRTIAQPRSRRPGARRGASGRSEKSVRFVSFAPDEDFGEAEFLMPDRDLEL